ncbi:hypothetical protein BCU84_14520 [Shewanella sp. 10N.286.51.B7]|uniref:hypothetical protein n=1 Tax=Shewanella sp. 10N.286.51.B7 TaxID=1880836 RepID=UPI000C84DD38|nr:hypothetical protein [Shewanella sp. 10N.286.51.B7]PMG75944.1 hypothetical protein BCU84_14520 [Shewanella sp. 10N.286.51.B7]
MFTESNAYFTVPHQFNVYLESWPESKGIPTEADLRSMQSVGLKLLSEVKELEASCLLQLRGLDNDAKAVVDFLKLQSRKVDLVLHHVLEKEVQTGDKFLGSHFGGSGISLTSDTALNVDDYFKTSIYISSELVAILCLCQVTQCQRIENESQTGSYNISLEFSQILDADVEQLVKASLNVQQKMLKMRKQSRQQSVE